MSSSFETSHNAAARLLDLRLGCQADLWSVSFNRTHSPVDSEERVITAVDVFSKLAQAVVDTNDSGALADLCAEDVVFEFPFAPPGRPARVEGKAALGEYLKGLSGRMRIEGVRNLEIHETVQPDVAVIEMTLTGTVTATGAPYEQSYVVILTVRDGLIARYRDYWNPLRVAE